jgi:hypothetical protein
MEKNTEPVVQATAEAADTETDAPKDQHFVEHAQKVAQAINHNGVETSAGFAACHGFMPQRQYNKDES